jgi:hypothetical protein
MRRLIYKRALVVALCLLALAGVRYVSVKDDITIQTKNGIPRSVVTKKEFWSGKYRSTAAVHVMDHVLDFGGGRLMVFPKTSTSPEAMGHKSILYRVLCELRLPERWGQPGKPLPQEEIYTRLRKSTKVRITPGPGIADTNAEVDFRSNDKAESAEIADKIADTYIQRRIDHDRDTNKAALGSLVEEVETLESVVEALKTRIVALFDLLNSSDSGLSQDRESASGIEKLFKRIGALSIDELVKEADALGIGNAAELGKSGKQAIAAALRSRLDSELVAFERPLLENKRHRKEYALVKTEYAEKRRLLEAAKLRLEKRRTELKSPSDFARCVPVNP